MASGFIHQSIIIIIIIIIVIIIVIIIIIIIIIVIIIIIIIIFYFLFFIIIIIIFYYYHDHYYKYDYPHTIVCFAIPAGVDVGDDEEEESKPTPSVVSNGRLGPDTVLFDISTNVGTLVIEPDRLGVRRYCLFIHLFIYSLILTFP